MYTATAPTPKTLGSILPAFKIIRLLGFNQTPKTISETFWHEVTHAILYDMGDPRWKDEKFVEGFSKRLNEVVHSAKF